MFSGVVLLYKFDLAVLRRSIRCSVYLGWALRQCFANKKKDKISHAKQVLDSVSLLEFSPIHLRGMSRRLSSLHQRYLHSNPNSNRGPGDGIDTNSICFFFSFFFSDGLQQRAAPLSARFTRHTFASGLGTQRRTLSRSREAPTKIIGRCRAREPYRPTLIPPFPSPAPRPSQVHQREKRQGGKRKPDPLSKQGFPDRCLRDM